MVNDKDLDLLSREELIIKLVELREAIRYATRQSGDNYCFLDFIRLHKFLPEHQPLDGRLLSEDLMMKNCNTFYHCMKESLADPKKSIDDIYKEWENLKPY